MPCKRAVVYIIIEIGVSNSEALEIIRVAKRTSEVQPPPTLHPTLPLSHPHTTPHQDINHHNVPRLSCKGHTALDLLHREQVRGSIVTFCAGIDSMMGGGVALGKVTEFCGGPGLGKTQMRYKQVSRYKYVVYDNNVNIYAQMCLLLQYLIYIVLSFMWYKQSEI